MRTFAARPTIHKTSVPKNFFFILLKYLKGATGRLRQRRDNDMSFSLSFLRLAAFRIQMLAMFLILVPLGFAQSELATVFGRVTDQSGAVVSQAAVEIRNVETNAVASTTTNSDGLYSLPALHPGHYVISV